MTVFAALSVGSHSICKDKTVYELGSHNRRPVSSVFSRAPDSSAGGRRFKPRPDQHPGSLNN